MKNNHKYIRILGIETSCDETSASIVEANIKDKKASQRRGSPKTAKSKNAEQRLKIRILSNIVSSQIDLHRQYGGVYPELASRAHLENILPAIKAALEKAKTELIEIDAIAVTVGPGLIGSLLVGVETARSLAYSLNKPLIGVNHLEGHIAANFVGEKSKNPIPDSQPKADPPRAGLFLIPNSRLYPIVCLIVSGGHTSLVLMKDYGKYQTIGQTRDDAAGEAFDKVAQILGFDYPGGPAIEEAIKKIQNSKLSKQIKLPRPMISSSDFDFSFSGLKTAVLQLTKKLGPIKAYKYQVLIAAEFQQAVIDVLVAKTIRASNKLKPKTIVLSGGVAANKLLRKEMAKNIKKYIPDSRFLFPDSRLCTDNAAMIAVAGAFHFLKNPKFKKSTLFEIKARPNLNL